MANEIDWINGLDKSQKKKPNIQLQNEISKQLQQAFISKEATDEECADAFWRIGFSNGFIDVYYQSAYVAFSPEDKDRWDKAVVASANKAQSQQYATRRLTAIIGTKLSLFDDVSLCVQELQWLSTHSNDKLMPSMKEMKDGSPENDRRKLLTLNVKNWVGYTMIKNMFSVLFEGTSDPETKAAYEAFQIRNGYLMPAKQEVEETVPEVRDENTMNETPEPEVQEQPVESKSVESAPVATDEAAPQAPVQNAPEKTGIDPRNPVALANAMLGWIHQANDERISLQSTISDLKGENEKAKKSIAALREELQTSNARVASLQAESLSLSMKLADSETLNKQQAEQITSLENDVVRLQQMAVNTAKQEADTLRTQIAAWIRSDIKDYREFVESTGGSDFQDRLAATETPEEKANVYDTVLEGYLLSSSIIDSILRGLQQMGIMNEEK